MNPDCNVTVCGQSAHRDFKQSFPYLQLEIRPFQVQLYLLKFAPVLGEDGKGLPLPFILGLDKLGTRKFPHQSGKAVRRVIGKLQATDSFGGGGHKSLPKGAFRQTMPDGKVLAAVLVFAGSHSLNADKQVVKPARTR